MEYELSEQDRAAMAGMDVQILAEERAEEAKRQSVLAEVQRVVGQEVYKAIVDELADSSYTHSYLIAEAPIGQEQDDGGLWGKTFVNQTTNGGYTGDEYAGTVSIPLGDGRFFQFAYSM